MDRILQANGSPATPQKVNFQPPIYAAGPLEQPTAYQPVTKPDGNIQMAVFGGATRLEVAASRILGGVLNPDELLHSQTDDDFRRRLARAAVALAATTIEESMTFGQPQEATSDGDTGSAAAAGGSAPDTADASGGAQPAGDSVAS